jgi:hypothetical protein
MIVPKHTLYFELSCRAIVDDHQRVPNTGWHSAVKALACPAIGILVVLSQRRAGFADLKVG